MVKFRRNMLLMSICMLVAMLIAACGANAILGSAPAVIESKPQAPAARARPEQQALVLAIGGTDCLCYLPATLAYHLGYFKDEGLTIDMQDLKGGSKALSALMGGSADVVAGYYDHTIRMQTKDKQLTSFVNFAQMPGLVLLVSDRAAAKIKSVKDLKGAKVGVSSPGSSTHVMINYLLYKEGLKPSDIAVISVGIGATAVAAVENGSVDAVVTADPTVTQLLERGSARILVDTRAEKDTRLVFGGDFSAASLYTTAEFLRRNPVTAQALANAVTKSLQYIATHSPEEIAAQMPAAYQSGNQALYVKALRAAQPGYSRDGLMSDAAASSTLEVLAISDDEVRAAQNRIKLAATYTNDFVNAAHK